MKQRFVKCKKESPKIFWIGGFSVIGASSSEIQPEKQKKEDKKGDETASSQGSKDKDLYNGSTGMVNLEIIS